MFIYFWDRERQSMSRGGAEREGDTDSEVGSRMWAVSTEHDAGLEPTNHEIMIWAETKSLMLNQLNHPGAPPNKFFFLILFIYLKKNFFNVYFIFETERDRAWTGRGRERGRHRIWNRLQALSHQPRARRGAQTHRLRDHDLSGSRPLNRLSHPGAPVLSVLELYINGILL